MKVLKEQYSDNTVAISQTDEGTVLITKWMTTAEVLSASISSQSKKQVSKVEPVQFDGGTGYKIIVKGTTDMREVLPYLIDYNVIQG